MDAYLNIINPVYNKIINPPLTTTMTIRSRKTEFLSTTKHKNLNVYLQQRQRQWFVRGHGLFYVRSFVRVLDEQTRKNVGCLFTIKTLTLVFSAIIFNRNINIATSLR